MAILRSPDLAIVEVGDVGRMIGPDADIGTIEHILAGFPLTLNGQRHETVRRWMIDALKGIAPAFSPEAVAQETRHLCAAQDEGVSFDGLGALCDPLPIRILAKATGLPVPVVARIATSGLRLFVGFYGGKSGRQGLTPGLIAQFDKVADRLVADTIAALEAAGGSPILSLADLRAREGRTGEGVDPLMAFIYLIVSATETTAGALCNALSVCLTDDAARQTFGGARPGSLTFGGGPHRCIGASVATTTIAAFLRVTLREEKLRLVRADLSRERYSATRRGRTWKRRWGSPGRSAMSRHCPARSAVPWISAFMRSMATGSGSSRSNGWRFATMTASPPAIWQRPWRSPGNRTALPLWCGTLRTTRPAAPRCFTTLLPRSGRWFCSGSATTNSARRCGRRSSPARSAPA
ncbi:hypothetical protein RDV64_08095 [Acuticoccus sp. MNP-M23]|uniref:hypothetical protein n=1 Tax=Acuticoccus sp. MNP-M23 TaxID=3072793 RepID=UPI0028153547|nr:hypothetical protein [Acuticoccus sp. MNP-M23]WMS44340.1 hypothetical protein RDV64_08095 [Acuticoccus sp. MNP-M23]